MWNWIRKNYWKWQDPQNGEIYAHGLPAITERSKENPIVFDALLKLVEDQPEQADSLLAGIEKGYLELRDSLSLLSGIKFLPNYRVILML